MKRWVIDASVVIEWLQPQRDELVILQPVHWLAEVAAVLARISPVTDQDDMTDL